VIAFPPALLTTTAPSAGKPSGASTNPSSVTLAADPPPEGSAWAEEAAGASVAHIAIDTKVPRSQGMPVSN